METIILKHDSNKLTVTAQQNTQKSVRSTTFTKREQIPQKQYRPKPAVAKESVFSNPKNPSSNARLLNRSNYPNRNNNYQNEIQSQVHTNNTVRVVPKSVNLSWRPIAASRTNANINSSEELKRVNESERIILPEALPAVAQHEDQPKVQTILQPELNEGVTVIEPIHLQGHSTTSSVSHFVPSETFSPNVFNLVTPEASEATPPNENEEQGIEVQSTLQPEVAAEVSTETPYDNCVRDIMLGVMPLCYNRAAKDPNYWSDEIDELCDAEIAKFVSFNDDGKKLRLKYENQLKSENYDKAIGIVKEKLKEWISGFIKQLREIYLPTSTDQKTYDQIPQLPQSALTQSPGDTQQTYYPMTFNTSTESSALTQSSGDMQQTYYPATLNTPTESLATGQQFYYIDPQIISTQPLFYYTTSDIPQSMPLVSTQTQAYFQDSAPMIQQQLPPFAPSQVQTPPHYLSQNRYTLMPEPISDQTALSSTQDPHNFQAYMPD